MCIYTSAVNVQGHLPMSDPETDTYKQKTQTSVTTLPSAVAAEGKLCHLPVNDIILSPLLVHLWTWGTPLEAMGPRGDGGDGEAETSRRCPPGTETAVCGLYSHLYILTIKTKHKLLKDIQR